MKKYKIFKEMLDYMARIADVTDADMNYCGNSLRIEGDTEEDTIIIEVAIKSKEVNNDGN